MVVVVPCRGEKFFAPTRVREVCPDDGFEVFSPTPGQCRSRGFRPYDVFGSLVEFEDVAGKVFPFVVLFDIVRECVGFFVVFLISVA